MLTVFDIPGPYSGADEGYDLVVCDAVYVGQPTLSHTMSLQYCQNCLESA